MLTLFNCYLIRLRSTSVPYLVQQRHCCAITLTSVPQNVPLLPPFLAVCGKQCACRAINFIFRPLSGNCEADGCHLALPQAKMRKKAGVGLRHFLAMKP
jgi:hypothetical protein